MFHLLKVTAVNLPRTTRAAGVVLVLALGLIYGWVATHAAMPGYLAGLLLVACAGAAIAGFALLAGSRRVGWPLASAVAGACFVAYLAGRAVTGAWHSPLGTLALFLEAGVIALSASLLLGRSVDEVGARDWETYYSHPRPEHEEVFR